MKNWKRVSHEERTSKDTSFAAKPFVREFIAIEATPQERVRAWFQYYGFGISVLLVFVVCAIVLLSDVIFPRQRNREIELEAQQLANLYSSSKFQPGAAATELRVDSYPPNATVFLDFDSVGVTPLRIPAVPLGLHIVSVEKEGYELVDTVLTIYESKSDWIVLKMKTAEITPANTRHATGTPQKDASNSSKSSNTASEQNTTPEVGMISITSNPEGAAVRLDGKIIGQTPLVLSDLRRGQYAIRLEMSGHVPYSTVLQIKPGDHQDVYGELKKLTEKLTLQINPSGKIIIDGVVYATHAEGKFVVNLPIGKHTLEVEHQSKRRFETEIEIKPNRPRSLIIDLSQ